LLDTDIPQNEEDCRGLTALAYGGDNNTRIRQEIILGIGGVRMLRALGYTTIDRYHMNEGHAALGTLELFNQYSDVEKVREQCVFTTHTPVPAGHDSFDENLMRMYMSSWHAHYYTWTSGSADMYSASV
jgi:glucan phosphorylase